MSIYLKTVKDKSNIIGYKHPATTYITRAVTTLL